MKLFFILLHFNRLYCLVSLAKGHYLYILDSVWYLGTSLLDAHKFPHFFDGRVGWHVIHVGHLVFVHLAVDFQTGEQFPEHQTQAVDVGHFEGQELVHVDGLVQVLRRQVAFGPDPFVGQLVDGSSDVVMLDC